MNNDIQTIDTNNYAQMAKAMGIAGETGSADTSKANPLPRMRLHHNNIMGIKKVGDQSIDAVVVKGGSFKLERPDLPVAYAPTVQIRPFIQRFMYKRFVKNMSAKSGEPMGMYHKTLMADNLNSDMKDNQGNFNCGKPSGFIKDFKALPVATQEVIKQIKRVRVIFGLIDMPNATDESGEPISLDDNTPFIWEIDNRDAFKTMGEPFTKFNQTKRLPVQHYINLTSEERKLPSGSSFYLPNYSLDLQTKVEVDDDDQNTFINFMAWIDNYNTYIFNEWEMKAKAPVSKEDKDLVNEFIDVDVDEEVA
jgi:hypothetical protein|tara:strand:+ start:675 stop:1595 length:921 start_codon:yes stop_codon:yes gene_type:complete